MPSSIDWLRWCDGVDRLCLRCRVSCRKGLPSNIDRLIGLFCRCGQHLFDVSLLLVMRHLSSKLANFVTCIQVRTTCSYQRIDGRLLSRCRPRQKRLLLTLHTAQNGTRMSYAGNGVLPTPVHGGRMYLLCCLGLFLPGPGPSGADPPQSRVNQPSG